MKDKFVRQQKGITLIALVISIIVMLILSAVSINATIGQDGIVTRSQKAAFYSEMTALQESVDMKRVSFLMQNVEETQDTHLFEESAVDEMNSFPETLAAEIYFTRNGMSEGTKKDAKELLKQNSIRILVETFKLNKANFKNSLYYIDEETCGKNKKYLYDSETKICYKIDATSFGGNTFHSLTYANMVLDGSTTFVENGLVTAVENKQVTSSVTDADGNTKMVTVSAYEPDMNGFTVSKTYMVYYNQNDETVELSLQDYLSKNKPRLVDTSGNAVDEENQTESTFKLYDYANQIWANVRCLGKNEKGATLETWWTWIPRYAYKINNYSADVKFIDVSNKYYDSESGSLKELENTYTVHSAFTQTSNTILKGIWVAKYPPSQSSSSDKTIAPDFNGFAGYNETEENNSVETNVLAFSEDCAYYVEIPLSTYQSIFSNVQEDNYSIRKLKVQTKDGNEIKNLNSISGWSKDSIGKNITSVTQVVSEKDSDGKENVGQDFYIYNYAKQIWANCRTKNTSTGAESYWVWIPRYAYALNGEASEIIFVDVNDMPVDSDISMLPSFYQVHEAFNQNNTALSGIWIAKYDVSATGNDVIKTTNKANEPNLQDATIYEGFSNATKVRFTYYSDDGAATTTKDYTIDKFKVNEVYSLENIAETITYDGRTYYLTKYDQGKYLQFQAIDPEGKSTKTYRWIPRFAERTVYGSGGVSKNDAIRKERIYVDVNDKPVDIETYGNSLPSGFTVDSMFETNVSGIWQN